MFGSDMEGPSEQWLNQFPAILIVTSSMVIDQSLRKDLIEERVRCQIWLWFCMILSLRSHPPSSLNDTHIQKEDLVCETWMHLTIVSNLASIGVLAISSPLERIKKSNKGNWWFSFAAWTTMLASSCLFSQLRYTEGSQEESIAMFSVEVYMVSLCILWMIHWHKRRKEKLEQEMRNITGGSSKKLSSFVMSQDMDGFDRSLWYTWKPSTTLRWISHVLESDDDIDPGVVQQLVSHRIDGKVLDTLTVSQLLQLQVPYGPACHLHHAIQNELVRPFPRPREAELGNGMLGSDRNFVSYSGEMQAHSGDFLSGFDQEYNSDRPRNFAQKSSGLADSNSFAAGAEMLSLDAEKEDRVAEIMKERYGLELPRLRSAEGSTSEQDSVPSKAADDTADESPLQQSSMLKKPPPSSTLPKVAPSAAGMPIPPIAKGEIPEVLLKQMPPNIQDIAKRRPELVRQMILSRQLQTQQHQQREDQLYTHAEEGGGEYVSNDDDSSNDESSRLIRRKKDHHQYKSTGL